MIRCHYRISARKPPARTITPRPYPYSPITIGDYLRKRRIDLGLRQKDVAKLLKTNSTSIHNWENNLSQPFLQALSEIINFIGFCPYDSSLPIFQKLIIWRSFNGISQKEMAELIGVDPSTLARWEQNKRIPSFKQQQRISAALARIGEISQKNATENSSDKFNLKREITRQIRRRLNEDFKIRLSEAELRLILKRINSVGYVLYESNWSIDRKLIAWRTSFGLSQRQIARLTGFSDQTFCRWEMGKRTPHPQNVIHLKNFLGNLAELLSSCHRDLSVG